MSRVEGAQTPAYHRFSGDGRDYHGHYHEHSGDGHNHDHIHTSDHHMAASKSVRFARMYGAGDRRAEFFCPAGANESSHGQCPGGASPGSHKGQRYARAYGASDRVIASIETVKVKPFCCDAAARESESAPPRRRHTHPHLHRTYDRQHHLNGFIGRHEHNHADFLRGHHDESHIVKKERHRHEHTHVESEYGKLPHNHSNGFQGTHTHLHPCGHHRAERGLAGQIVTSTFTGRLAYPTMMEAHANINRRGRDENFRIQYEGVPSEGPTPAKYSGRQRGTTQDIHYDDRVMRRFTVYYVDNFSTRTADEGPKHVMGRRAPRPDMVIETALALLKQKGVDPKDPSITLFLLDVGADKGYGQMIDVKMHRITITTTPKWELTPFTTL